MQGLDNLFIQVDWQGGAQPLQHSNGLWDVAQLENGDIVSAGQDRVNRVWTTDPSRFAPVAAAETFGAEVAAAVAQIEAAKRKALYLLLGISSNLLQRGSND